MWFHKLRISGRIEELQSHNAYTQQQPLADGSEHLGEEETRKPPELEDCANKLRLNRFGIVNIQVLNKIDGMMSKYSQTWASTVLWPKSALTGRWSIL